MNWVANPRRDVEVKQLRPGAGQHNVLRFDVAVNKSVLTERHKLVILITTELAVLLFLIEGVEPFAVGVDGGQSAENVEGDVDRFTVAELLLARGVLSEELTLDVLHDQVPLTASVRSAQMTWTTLGWCTLRSALISRRTAS